MEDDETQSQRELSELEERLYRLQQEASDLSRQLAEVKRAMAALSQEMDRGASGPS